MDCLPVAAVVALLPSICLRVIQILKDEPIGGLDVENCIEYRLKTCANSPGQERLYTKIYTLGD